MRSDIKRINQLKGKTIATAQFTEVDFFIRYLAQEAGLPINTLGSLDATPHPERLNIVYTEDGFGAGDLFLNEMKSGKNRLAGCVTWEPKVSEVVDGSGGQAHVLTTNRNLLIIADVLIVHRGFAQEQPEDRRGARAGPARGQPHGPRSARPVPRRHRPVVQVEPRRHEGRARQGAPVEPAGEPSRSSRGRSTRPAASTSIYQSAVLAYGSDLIKDPPDASRFASLAALQTIEKSGIFKEQKVAIAPIRSTGGGSLEADPLLSKDIRFLFEANSSTLDMSNQENIKNLEAIKRLLQVSPGSTLLLRGHVDNAQGRRVPPQGRRGARAHDGAARDGAEQGPRRRRSARCSSSATTSTRSASTSSAAAGKSPSGPIRTRIVASKCSGSRSSSDRRGRGSARGRRLIESDRRCRLQPIDAT